MSGAAARLAAPMGRPSVPSLAAVEQRDSLPLRLLAFAALAGFGVGQWWGLVVQPPAGRALALVVIATAGAGLLGLVGRLSLPRPLTLALASALTLAMLAGGLAAAGLHPRLLLPGGWGGLADGLDRGLSGMRTVDWPYDGPDGWVRLTILLGAPALMTAAAAFAFWPARKHGRPARAAALALLLVLYGVAVTNRDPGSPFSRGFALLLLLAVWLWLPRLGRRDALAAVVITLTAGVCALPVASALDGGRPWWNYRSFDWFGGGKTVAYDWNHSYGPLDWPRDGTTLLNVKSSRPLYWKAETLNEFDGVRWLRVRSDAGNGEADLPQRFARRGRRWHYFQFNPRWDEHARVTVRSLRSDLVIGPGTIYEVSGAGSTVTTGDGTTVKLDGSLSSGDSYSVRAYVPHPTAAQMRAAPAGFPEEMARYTAIGLPHRSEVVVPLRGDPQSGSPGAADAVLRSPYSGVYRLAQAWTAGAPTAYDAVARIESQLEHHYAYDEKPPRRRNPLVAFLLRDRIGYCQQFSGAMALMLRMIGIPSRVAGGFSPGSFNKDTGEFRVRDLDAHSWVEVYVNGVGWVTFDPTPAAAPAAARTSGIAALAGSIGRTAQLKDGGAGSTGRQGVSDAPGGAGGGGGEVGWWILPLALGLMALAGAGWLGFRFVARRRPAAPAETVDAQVRELASALPRLGWRLPGGTTLLAIERRLGRVAGPGAAGYVAGLRAHRYDPEAPEAPDRTARRALRKALAAAVGRWGRLRVLVAIPPGGPFRRL